MVGNSYVAKHAPRKEINAICLTCNIMKTPQQGKETRKKNDASSPEAYLVQPPPFFLDAQRSRKIEQQPAGDADWNGLF